MVEQNGVRTLTGEGVEQKKEQKRKKNLKEGEKGLRRDKTEKRKLEDVSVVRREEEEKGV